MQDVWQLLRQKEEAIEQVRREVEALRFVCPWFNISSNVHLPTNPDAATALKAAMCTVGPLLADTVEEFDPMIRERLIKGAEIDSMERKTSRFSRHLRRIGFGA